LEACLSAQELRNAQIEHEVVYKSGIKYPDETLRRFASVAGTLEILEREFLSLKEEKAALVKAACESITQRFVSTTRLSPVRLCALLSIERREGVRFAEVDGLPTGIESLCVEALRRSRIGDIGRLRSCIRSKRMHRLVQRYASNTGSSVDTVSDFVLILLVLKLNNPEVLQDLFPEFLADQGLMN